MHAHALAHRARLARSSAKAKPVHRCASPPRAFTLTEVLICLAIITLIAAVAWPAMLSYAREQTLRESAYRITRELDALRNDAERRSVALAAYIEVPAQGAATITVEQLDPSNLAAVVTARNQAGSPGDSTASFSSESASATDTPADTQARRLYELSSALTIRQPGELSRSTIPSRQRQTTASMTLLADPDEGMNTIAATDRRWLLAVYLPDGTVVPSVGIELALGNLGPLHILIEPALGKARAVEPSLDPMLTGTPSNGSTENEDEDAISVTNESGQP